VAHGASVVNLSLGEAPDLLGSLLGGLLGGGGGDNPLLSAIEDAWNAGTIPVLAAGNDPGTPARYPNLHAVVVAAGDRQGRLAPYSSPLTDVMWGLMAPGGSGPGADPPNCASNASCQNILSTFRGSQYALLEGTSMAAPHVSGALALLRAKGYDKASAVQRLLDTARPAQGCNLSCHGLLDVGAALGGAPTPASPGPTAAPAPAPGGLLGLPLPIASKPTATRRRTPATAAPSTTGAPTTTLPPTTEAPTTTVGPELAVPPLPGGPSVSATGHGEALGHTAGDHRNPVVPATAAGLLGSVALALGRVSWLRLRRPG
jgi:subtilisin family serine protease